MRVRPPGNWLLSSDCRYEASAAWERVRSGGVAADGGWRIYSSGPGLYAYILIQHVFGMRRRFGERICEPRLPESQCVWLCGAFR